MPSAMASAATAICTPASSWCTTFMVAPWPGVSPSTQTLVAMASSTGLALAIASALPAAIRVSCPSFARAAPPETGASTYRKPRAVVSAARSRASAGAMVAETISTAPGARRGAAPSGPKTAARAWAALTVKITAASVPCGRSAPPATAAPPAFVKASRASARGSIPVTAWPARSRLSAAPMPMEPSPMTATCISASCEFSGDPRARPRPRQARH